MDMVEIPTTTPAPVVEGTLSGSSSQNDKSHDNNNSISSIKSKLATPNKPGSKQPAWSQEQLQEAIYCVITQRMRFTQASSRYGIPKGTLYDNILGKSKRMKALEEVSLSHEQEILILEFCCEISLMPYNRRTSRSLRSIMSFVEKMLNESPVRGENRNVRFQFSLRKGFRWWWAFCKKYSIISLYFDDTQPLGDVTKIDLDSDTFSDLLRWQSGNETALPPPAHSRPVMCGGATGSIPFSFHAHAHASHHQQHDLSTLYSSFLNAHSPHSYLSPGLNYPQNLSLPQPRKTLKHSNENWSRLKTIHTHQLDLFHLVTSYNKLVWLLLHTLPKHSHQLNHFIITVSLSTILKYICSNSFFDSWTMIMTSYF